MFAVNVKGDIKDIASDLNKLEKRITPAVATRSINYAARKLESAGVKRTAKDVRLPAKYIRYRFTVNYKKKGNRVAVSKARWSDWTADVYIYGREIPIATINTHKPAKKGFRVAGRQFPKAFKQIVKGGPQIFQRKGRSRYPLKVVKISYRAAALKNFGQEHKKSASHFRNEFNRLMRAKLYAR